MFCGKRNKFENYFYIFFIDDTIRGEDCMSQAKQAA